MYCIHLLPPFFLPKIFSPPIIYEKVVPVRPIVPAYVPISQYIIFRYLSNTDLIELIWCGGSIVAPRVENCNIQNVEE